MQGACTALRGEHPAVSALVMVPIVLLSLLAIPLFERPIARRSPLRALGFSDSNDEVVSFMPYLESFLVQRAVVDWRARRSDLRITAERWNVARVEIAGHRLYMCARCARELATSAGTC